MDVADLKILLYVLGGASLAAAAAFLLTPAAAFLPVGIACLGAVWLLR